MADGSGRVPAENRYLRLVFASEPVERLAGLRDRFAAAFWRRRVHSVKADRA
jgi:hypothetical protein